MITIKKGNFFDFDADLRVNTVNCYGVMGAGVALQFKNLYPEMFVEYKKLCTNKTLKPGNLHIWKSQNIFNKTIIINFPTKDHWKAPSEYEYIEKGLKALVSYLITIEPITITLPALGCGHAGLNWDIVKPMIYENLKHLNHNILLFETESSQNVPLNNINILIENNINVIAPYEINCPKKIKGKTSRQFVYIGNINLLNNRVLNLISSKKPTEKEKYILYEIIEELKNNNLNLSILLRGDKSYELDIIKYLLENDINTIVNPSMGLLNFKIRKDLKPLINDNNFLAYSTIKNQNEKWSINNFSSNYKESFNLSEFNLFNISDANEIMNLNKNLKLEKKLFYVNYFNSSNNDFNNLNIEKVGRNKEGKPNILKILK